MIHSISKLATTLTLLLFFTSIIHSEVIVKDLKTIDNMIQAKQTLLSKTQKSDTTTYMSLYDEIAELTILRIELSLQNDQIDDIDMDEICDLALNYSEVEFIKTQYYKTPFHDEVAKTLKNTVLMLQECNPPMAEQYLKYIIQIKEHIYTKESAESANAHDFLGDYYRRYMANFKKAIKEYTIAKNIREMLYKNDDSRHIENYHALATSIFYHSSDAKKDESVAKAESLVVDALKVIKLDENVTKARVTEVLLDTVYFYYMVRNDKKALQYAQEVENFLLKEGDGEKLKMVSVYEIMGDIYANMNDMKASKLYEDKALSIKSKNEKLKKSKGK